MPNIGVLNEQFEKELDYIQVYLQAKDHRLGYSRSQLQNKLGARDSTNKKKGCWRNSCSQAQKEYGFYWLAIVAPRLRISLVKNRLSLHWG